MVSPFASRFAPSTSSQRDTDTGRTCRYIDVKIGVGVDRTYRHDLIGKRTTFGYVSWYSNISKQDASVVKVMKDAGGE